MSHIPPSDVGSREEDGPPTEAVIRCMEAMLGDMSNQLSDTPWELWPGVEPRNVKEAEQLQEQLTDEIAELRAGRPIGQDSIAARVLEILRSNSSGKTES